MIQIALIGDSEMPHCVSKSRPLTAVGHDVDIDEECGSITLSEQSDFGLTCLTLTPEEAKMLAVKLLKAALKLEADTGIFATEMSGVAE